MKRKLLSLFFALAMLLSLLPMHAVAAETSSYSDTSGHWAEAAIESWSALGILQGSNGVFRPNAPITRGDLAIIIDRIMKYQTAAQNIFSDLTQDYYTDAILKVNHAGIMQGYASAIRPTDRITREEAFTMLGRALGLTESATGAAFDDSASISSFAAGFVNTAVSRGIIQGYENKFSPKDPITRAQVVTILNNAIAAIYSTAGEYSASVTGTVIVNTPNVVLKDLKITGDLIIAEGVGNGDVTLTNVTVTGKTLVRGGGENSIHIVGGSYAGIIIQKTDNGAVRVVTTDGAVVNAVVIDDGKDDVILTGSFGNVEVAADVSVKAVNATIAKVEVTGAGAAFDVGAGSNVTALTVAATATGTDVNVAGKIGTLTADAKTTIKNTGTIATANVNADGVIIDGNKPTEVKVSETVKEPPKDGSGKDVPTVPTPPSGGGGGGNVPPVSSIANVATLAELKAALADNTKTTINITSDITDIAETIKIERKVTINGGGAGKTLTFTGYDTKKPDTEQNAGILVKFVKDGDVRLNNIRVYMDNYVNSISNNWQGVYGIQVYGSKNVFLENCLATGGDAALLVNASEVTLLGSTDVSGNEFGGIEVSKGTAAGLGNSTLTLNHAYIFNETETLETPSVWIIEDQGELVCNTSLNGNKRTFSDTKTYYYSAEVTSSAQLANLLSADYIKWIQIVRDIELSDSAEVLNGQTLRVLENATLTVPADKMLTVNGTLYNDGTIGSTTNYVRYNLNANASVKGGGIFYGTLLAKGNGITIDGVTVYNRGDVSGENTWNRAAVYAYTNAITIKNCHFEINNTATGICNGVVILPISNALANYEITDNTFIGYDEEDSGFSSSGLLISGGVLKAFFGSATTSVPANLAETQELNIITSNTFENCTNDYQREDWTSGSLKIYCKSISNGSNLLLDYAASPAKYYITGDVTRNSDATVKPDTELIVTESSKLTVAAGATLTVNGTLTNNGEVLVFGTLVISDTEQLAGDSDIVLINNDDGKSTFMFGSTCYISGDLDLEPIALATGDIGIKGNEEGGYSVLITENSTLTIRKRNSASGDYYHHGAKDRIDVAPGGELIIAHPFGNNGTVKVDGTLTITGSGRISSGNPTQSRLIFAAAATVPNSDFVEGNTYTWSTTDGGKWVTI